jgi:hypothetical protein
MRHVMDSLPFGTTAEELAELFEGVAEELRYANQLQLLILGETSDLPGYFSAKDGTVARDRSTEDPSRAPTDEGQRATGPKARL